LGVGRGTPTKQHERDAHKNGLGKRPLIDWGFLVEN